MPSDPLNTALPCKTPSVVNTCTRAPLSAVPPESRTVPVTVPAAEAGACVNTVAANKTAKITPMRLIVRVTSTAPGLAA